MISYKDDGGSGRRSDVKQVGGSSDAWISGSRRGVEWGLQGLEILESS